MGCRGAILKQKISENCHLACVAPYCAMREAISAIPPYCALWGFWCLSMANSIIGCDVPSTFSEGFPLGEHAKWRCDTPPPPTKGYLSDTCAISHENKANGCETPSAILSQKGIARYGGVSRTGPLSVGKIAFRMGADNLGSLVDVPFLALGDLQCLRSWKPARTLRTLKNSKYLKSE